MAEPLPTRPAKRMLDVTLSGLLVLALVPVWLVVVGAMSLDMARCPRDRGALLYREPRVSRGRSFQLLKFRTLRRSVLDEAAGHARLFEREPENLTWAGRRVLKPLYIDELPQLLNVLRGEMSLVGPRPWPPELVERQVARGVEYRMRVTAGWTGPAQMSKGRTADFEALDMDYVALLESASSWDIVRRDLDILRRTLGTLLRGEGLAN